MSFNFFKKSVNKSNSPLITEIWINDFYNSKTELGVWCFTCSNSMNNIVSGNIKSNTYEKIILDGICKCFLINKFISGQIIIIHTQNYYLRSLINDWIHKWKKNNFLTETNKPRPNSCELKTLFDYISKFNVKANYIYQSERIKMLKTEAIKEYNKIILNKS